MRGHSIKLVLAIFFVSIGAAAASAQEGGNETRLAQWNGALDAIDEANGIGYVADLGCVLASNTCDKAFKFVERIAVKYRRLAYKSWRARGVNIPVKCFELKLDGGQIDRIYEAYSRAKGQLQHKLYATAYDLIGYGLIPWSDLECQVAARAEILRIRNLHVTVAGL
ncbi:MAG: hypothetical protein KJ622_15455 [Alphaproteobacteria bacterium]|nr:hypothetical protein [Alphaproteobacteria bacterium]